MLISRRQAIPLIILLLLSGCYASNSDYKDPKLPENIRLLQMGDSLQKVYATLGSPLWIEINSDLAGNGAYHQETSRQTDLFTVSRITADKNKEVFMIYSQPKNPGKNYILYAVDIREGKVFRKPKPSYQD